MARADGSSARAELRAVDIPWESQPATLLFIRDGASIVQPLIDGKRQVLRVSAPDRPCTWHTDHAKVRQILVNLLTNAVKFTDDGEVGIDLKTDGDHTEFTVWDTGIGIDDDTLLRIFDPFWQAEQPRTRRAEGSGLGLTVARRLARLLGGDLSVASQPTVGSRFTLRIPTRLPELTA